MGEAEVGNIEAYCVSCYYLLRGIGAKGKCPECGRDFELNDPRTFTQHPRRRRVWRAVRRPLAFLLLMLLAGAGSVGWLYWDWRQEQPAIAWVIQQGGSVNIRLIGPQWVQKRAGPMVMCLVGDRGVEGGAAWWAWLVERADDVVLTEVDASAVREPPPGRLRCVRIIALTGAGVTDEWMTVLGQTRELDDVTLALTRVGDEGLKRLGHQPRLRNLYLNGTPVTDAGLAALGSLPEIVELDLSMTKVQGSAPLTMLRRSPKLRSLSLLGATAVDDTAVEHLAKLGGLRTLDLRGTKMTRAGIVRLKAALPKTEILSEFP